MKRLRHKYGLQAYGLYWYCLELIAGNVDKNNITFELEEDAETIALEWDADQLKIQEMMQYMCEIGLFTNTNGDIACINLAKRLDDTNAKNPQIKSIIDKLNRSDSELVGVNRSKSDLVRPDKIRLDKNRIDKTKTSARFTPPSIEQVSSYCVERKNQVDPEAFVSHYESVNWFRGKTKIKDWKACVRTWEKGNNSAHVTKSEKPNGWDGETWI